MIYQIFFIPIWIINCSQMEGNNSEVFITYSGHTDLDRPGRSGREKEEVAEKVEKVTTERSEPTDGVVFIPNEKPIYRVGDEMKIDDIMYNRNIGDIMRDVNIATENPHQDTVFITGKNNENIEKQEKEVASSRRAGQDYVENPSKPTKPRQPRIDCTNLDCNNTVNSVCGGRQIEKKWKYRLFLNECFFRKVNCGFQHDSSRYVRISNEKCKNIGAHYVSRPFVFKPLPIFEESKVILNETRRSFSSRRSLNIGVDGSFCGHTCPTTCTEEYDPQCALSNSGTRKVFLNHCKLDYNSCLYKVVWHRRPLSECVGGKKADMNQNRGFIGWMQRVGIVDGRGRLVLS